MVPKGLRALSLSSLCILIPSAGVNSVLYWAESKAIGHLPFGVVPLWPVVVESWCNGGYLVLFCEYDLWRYPIEHLE